MGVLVGVGLSQLIGFLAGWSTIVTTTSIVLAFIVSVAIGLIFGLYPAARARPARSGQGAALRVEPRITRHGLHATDTRTTRIGL